MIRHNGKRGFLIAAKINALVALLLVVAGACWAGYNWNFLRTASTTNGYVIDFTVARGGYRPVVSYKVNGEVYTKQLLSGMNPSPFEVGDIVEVYYQPSEPTRIRINWFMNLWFGASMLAGAGLIEAIVAGSLYAVGYFKKSS